MGQIWICVTDKRVLLLSLYAAANHGQLFFLRGVCMLRECIYAECAHEQHVKKTLTLTHTITAYSVSGNVVRVRILICATRQKPCRKRVYRTANQMPTTAGCVTDELTKARFVRNR